MLEKSRGTELDDTQPPAVTDAVDEDCGQTQGRHPTKSTTPPAQRVPSDVNTALCSINTTSVTEATELIYATATVILEALGSRMQVEEAPPWTIRLEAKIRQENVR